MISFAGGLPAPELFDAEGMRAAFAAALADDVPAARCSTRRPRATRRCARAVAARLTARGLPDRGRRAARHERLAAGADADRHRAARPGRRRARRGAVLPRGAAGFGSPARGRAGAVRRRRADPEARGRAGRAPRRAPPLHVPTFQNPTGRTLPLERREALVGARRASRPVAARGRPLRRAALPRRGRCRRSSLPAPTTACSSLSTLSKIAAPGLRIGWLRAPRPLRRPLTIAKQAADLHTSTVDQAAAARWLQAVDLDEHVADLRARLRRRAATRCSTAWRTRCRPARPTTAPTAACSSGRGCPTAGTPRSCCERALDARRRVRARLPVLRRRARPAALRLSFTTHPPDEIAEGLRRLRAAWAG